MDNINIPRSQLVSNLFHLTVAGAKSALLPFLTIFFRQLGMSGTQVGILVAVKSVISVMFSAIWTSCAFSCDRRRSVLMMSVFSSMVACLLLSLVPPADPEYAKSFCYSPANNSTVTGGIVTGNISTTAAVSVTSSTWSSTLSITTSKISSMQSTASITKTTTTIPIIQSSSSVLNTSVSTKSIATNTLSKLSSTTETIMTSKPVNISTSTKIQRNTTTSPATSGTEEPHWQDRWATLSEDERSLFISMGYGRQQINTMSNAEMKNLVQVILENLKNPEPNKTNTRRKRDLFSSSFNSLSHRFAELKESFVASENTAFILVLSILIVGGVFSSSTEKLADRIWFDFLDGLDIIEKYGSHNAWYILGFMLVPLCVTAIVNNTPCILPHNIHHFSVHFYCYAGIMGMAFVWAFIYPILDLSNKTSRTTHVVKGMKILFANANSFSFMFSALLLGLITASIDNFLFWGVQDYDGSELVMGGAVAIAAFSELVMLVLMKTFLRKITHVGAVILAMIVMALRLIVYSFMWTPYIVLPLGILHGFSNTLIFGAIENYTDFKVNPFIMDRSARSVLDGIYNILGYACGSLLSGVLYDLVGLSTVYQGAAIMCVVWAMMFGVIHRCSRHKPRVRYARLLQAEADQVSDDEESVDDDWLEVALKHDK